MFSKNLKISFFNRLQHFLRSEPLLAIIVVVSFILAVVGIGYGLPFHVIGDEESLIGGALKMIQTHNLVPSLAPADFSFLYYPVIIPYLIILFSLPVIAFKAVALHFSPTALTDFFAVNQTYIWLAARMVSVVASVAMIALTYALGKLLFTKRIALFATVLLMTSFLHMNAAHWSRHWMLAAVTTYTVVYVTIRYFKNNKEIAWLPGISMAVAVATSYITVVGGVWVAMYAWAERKQLQNFWRFAIGNVALALVVGTTFIALHFSQIGAAFSTGDVTIAAPKTLHLLLFTLGFGVKVLLQQDTVLFCASLLALIFVTQYRRQSIIVFVTFIGYAFVLFYGVHIAGRYVYLLVPAFALTGALFFDWLFQSNYKIVRSIPVAALLYAFIIIVRYDTLLLQPDTRVLAAQWIRQNVGSSEFIMDSRSLRFSRTKESLEQAAVYETLNSVDRYSRDHYDRVAAAEPLRYSYSNVHFWKPGQGVDDMLAYIQTHYPKYGVIEYWSADDLDIPGRSLAAAGSILQSFAPSTTGTVYDIAGENETWSSVLFSLDRLGPMVSISKLR